jgi:hypothetical protein
MKRIEYPESNIGRVNNALLATKRPAESQPQLSDDYTLVAQSIPSRYAETQHTALPNAYVLGYEFWRKHKARDEPVASFVLSTASPSKAEIWAQLYWIAKHWVKSSGDTVHAAHAAKEATELLYVQTVRGSHVALDRAEVIPFSVFGERYGECFERARRVLGPADSSLVWPVLFTTH